MNDKASKSKRTYYLYHSLAFLIFGCLISFGSCRHVFCSKQTSSEWHFEPQNIRVKWTLKENVYCGSEECWVTQGERETFPQICPLLLQFGDKLLVSSDEALELYGINLLNVSQEDFESCSVPDEPLDQLLFSENLNGSRVVDLKWLSPGMHYFTALHESTSQLCKMGLRLNVTVKGHRCQEGQFGELCSGNGICWTKDSDAVFICQCHEHYFGNFCEMFDSCSSNPCLNGTVCISYGTTSPHQPAYDCICPSEFTGFNCSELFENCVKDCLNGRCHYIAPQSFQCVCDPGYKGPSCEEKENSSSCGTGSMGGASTCPEGSTGLSRDTKLNSSCASYGCRHEQACVTDNDSSDGEDEVRCGDRSGLCGSAPCLNNGSCTVVGEAYHCRCLRGFSGKNCEEIIDYCRLLGINCLNEGLCLNIIGGYNCLCAPGWTGEFCQHVENACLIFPDSCVNGATCIHTSQLGAPPQYTCACPRGYTGFHCEMEVNECDSNPCQHDGTCSDLVGHYKCTCPTDFFGENCEVNVDACKFANSTCPPGLWCVDLSDGMQYTCRSSCPHHIQPCANGGRCFLSNDGSTYNCVCPPGWTGPNCLENIDDCEGHWCQNGATCVDELSSYRCLCRHGYTGAFCEQDVDNCVGNLCSKHGTCLNHRYNYTCRCMLGYEGRYCELEADECSSSPCANGAMCVDFVGGYTCHCPAGFEGRSCSEEVNACWSRPCLNGGTCVDLINNYTCHCLLGFGGSVCEVDFNDCKSGPCQNGAVCVDGMGKYQCFCPHGFEGVNCEVKYNQCDHGLCTNNSTCIDLLIDYKCICPSGFGGLTGRFCEVNVDNCQNNPCGPLSICKDSLNAYDCFCAPGFIGNNCEIEVNECLSRPCQNGGSCFDELNAFSCLCPEGIEGDSCKINIDECHSSPCLHHGTCVDLINGYECICLLGFSGATCELDIDECSSSPCKNGATCVDRPGNYSCQCVAPFKGPNCEFLPCDASNPCENGASCVEEPDRTRFPLGFRCHCPHGFSGPRCETNVDECHSSPCLHGFCYDVVDRFYCLCNPGYAGLRCEQDIDDCATNMCENNSSCKDLHLSYQCLCEPGWEGEYCQHETDECASVPCKNNATCSDLLSSFKCICQPGWTGPDCSTKVNECDSKPCLNGASCVESAVPGQFTCACLPFYTGTLCQQSYDPCSAPHSPCLHNSTCLLDAGERVTCRCQPGFVGTHCEIDTDECSSSPCQNQGYCLDRVNNYSCECRDGFSGRHCEEEINECASSPCLNGAVCQDFVNCFQCHCPPGYFGTLCNLDVNECEDLPCLHSGICINKHGGFECKCLPGFSGVLCEINIDECVSEPCQNGGRCIDGPGRYQCSCSRGFMGLNCEANTDECISSPCLHGSCLDGIGGYSCQCEFGWAGHRCETNINECTSGPCLNGASCIDLINKYACFCRDGYTGRNCEADIDVCLESPRNFSMCFNGGSCVDGPGPNFTCRCPVGFVGPFCEVEFNECCSEPCLNGAICEDLVNGYYCHCRPGWTGLHCEDDINECLPQPCEQGMCIQNDPGHGYTCFCRPGFVGKNCEHNYDDCLMQTCPSDHYCVDGINEVSCVPIITSDQGVPAIPKSPQSTTLLLHPTSSMAESPENNQQPEDFSYVSYSGDSFLEFEGFDLGELNTVSVRFQTQAPEGMLLYVDQGPIIDGSFFIKLFIHKGELQYAFSCNSEEGIRRINTKIPVDDGNEHMVCIRHHMAPCDAEVEVSGYEKVKSVPSNYWSGFSIQRTGHFFTGGLPYNYPLYEESSPFYNYTGCIEIIEINKMNRFHVSRAIGGSNVNNCRPLLSSPSIVGQPTVTPPALSTSWASLTMAPTPAPTRPVLACDHTPCRNGGTCQPLWLASGAASFLCDCPLHFSGHLCEQDTTVFFPSFNGNSYLELPSLASILQSGGDAQSPSSQDGEDTVTLHLSLQTGSSHGTILYTQEQNFGSKFLHVFLKDGRPALKLGCGGNHILTRETSPKISGDRLTPITVRYSLPNGGHGGECTAEIGVLDNGTENLQQTGPSHPASQVSLRGSVTFMADMVAFGPIFLGGMPSQAEVRNDAGFVTGLVGCIRELQVNNRELHVTEEAVGGKNIRNCGSPVCQYQPCRNGGTCVSDSENWFCKCPGLYSGKLCQLTACERNPCRHGATCVPTSTHHAVCLCPYGRAGLLCEDRVNVTRARFGGRDEFGYTSFLAYSSIPSASSFYEFSVKLTFANNGSAMKDNLILFTGQKGQGINGDDFLVLGVRSGRIVHRFNLGSGVGTVVSGPLNRRLGIHTVQFGRSLRMGWLKVDDQKNKTGSSPGPLVSLNVFGQLYVGGYSEYVPQLLPAASRFRNGFQGCIFDLQFRKRRGARFRAPGIPEGHPSSGRSVGQCGDSPCSLVHCENGGTCVETAATAYCRCPLGWKGALCSETTSPCDAQHEPAPACAQGSTCVPIPGGYRCQCPLGTGGRHCHQGVALSDPFFNGSRSSWMSFPPVGFRRRTDVKMEFKTLSPEGILFYVAQHLSPRAGDFFSVSLSAGFLQLRYNLGDRTVTLRSEERVDTNGSTWHTVRAGRAGRQGYLTLDGKEAKADFKEGMTALDVGTRVFVGGVPALDAISRGAVENEPTGFSGCIREVVVNGHELELTEKGASGGADVEDCDGTACGHRVCRNGGRCDPVGTEAFGCACPPLWSGPTCEQSVYCLNNRCQHGSSCIPNVTAASYTCACSLGWEGRHCEEMSATMTASFAGSSYLRYVDPQYHLRNLTYTEVSFNFTSSSSDGLILWMGKAEDEDDDYLAVGLQDNHLKIGINLGERISVPFVLRSTRACCDRWKSVSVIHNRTVIQVFLDGDRVLFENVDPYETYVAMNYGGVCYLGGFESHRQTWEVTQGLFSKGFVGQVRDLNIYGEKVYS